MKLENGLRGAVLLAPGVFTCSNTLTLSVSGVVLRGNASTGAATRTTIRLVLFRRRIKLQRAAQPRRDVREVRQRRGEMARRGRGVRRFAASNTVEKIAVISGNTITVDVPLTDSFDANYLNPPGTAVVKIRTPARVTQVGIENLHIECPPQEINHTQLHFTALRINAEDAWVRDVKTRSFRVPLTLILSPLRAGRGEQERTGFGSLFGGPDTVPP